jgi:hypothetical protein
VKAVCAKLGGVETLDLAEALDEFSQACVKFDCAKGDKSFLEKVNRYDPWPVGTVKCPYFGHLFDFFCGSCLLNTKHV